MNILISHVYSSENNGDATILSAQIAELRRVFPGAEMHISIIDRVARGQCFDGVGEVEALMYGAVVPGRGRLRKLLFALGMVSYTLLWSGARRLRIGLPLPSAWRKPIRTLEQADLQVCVGGGYLRARSNDPASTVTLLLLVHQIWLARSLGKPVYLYAQSFGPYPTRLQRRLARSGIRAASLILVREAKSKVQLADLGIAEDRVVKVPDSAFLFRAPRDEKVAQLVRPEHNEDTIVGITVRSWLDPERQTVYEAAIAQLVAYIAAKPGYRVVVIPQVTSISHNDDDREAGARIARRLKPADNIVFLKNRFTHTEILSVYGSLDFLVGTRFHSVIFALLSRIPAVAIEYEHKTSGIMQDLSLDKWVIPIEAVTAEELIQLLDSAIARREDYQRKLDQVLPPYVAKARLAADLIAQDYASRRSE